MESSRSIKEHIYNLRIDDVCAQATNFCVLQISKNAVFASQIAQQHKSEFYSLLFLQSGKATVYVQNEEVQLYNQQVIIINPSSLRSFQFSADARAYVICFTETFFSLRYHDHILQKFAFYNQDKSTFPISIDDQKKWISLMDFMLQEDVTSTTSQATLRSYLNILLQETEKYLSDVSHQKHVNEKIAHFMQLVDEQFRHHKNPSYYADRLHISPGYLNKLCKLEQLNTSSEIIRNRILMEAKRLLNHTKDTVSEIAYALGFESPSYFNTFFKKNAGITPEKYRKQELN